MTVVKNKQCFKIGYLILVFILSFIMSTTCVFASQGSGVIDVVHNEQMQAQNFNLKESEIDNISLREMLKKSKMKAYTTIEHKKITNLHVDTSNIKHIEGEYPIYFYTDKGTRIEVFVHVLTSHNLTHIQQKDAFYMQASFMWKFSLFVGATLLITQKKQVLR